MENEQARDSTRVERSSPASVEHPALKTPTQARQGVTGHNVRYVLGFGLLGVAIAFVIIYLVYFA